MGGGRFECLIRGRDAYVAAEYRLAAEVQLGLARVALRRHGGDCDGVVAIRQGAAETEGAVGTKWNRSAANRHARAGLRGAVDDKLGIDVKPES